MNTRRKQTVLELTAEVLLSFLPMVLVMLVLLHQDKLGTLFLRPEWAFAAAIFFGQTIVRLVCAIACHHSNLHAGFLSLVVVLLILLGLGPACAIVVLVLFAEEAAGHLHAELSVQVQALQVLLYGLSAAAYVFVGATARELERPADAASE